MTRVAHRGLVHNLDLPGVLPGPVHVVVGLADYLALAGRRLACVGLPRIEDRPRAGLPEAARLLRGVNRPIRVPTATSDPDPLAIPRALARRLRREIGDRLSSHPIPAPHASVHDFVTATAAATDRGGPGQ